MHISLAGYFRLRTFSPTGEVTGDTDWFPNLITNQGMDWYGQNPPNNNTSYGTQYLCTHCGVGLGSTPPAFTDTHLTSFLAMEPPSSDSNVEGFSYTNYVAGPPAYWSGVWTYTFAQGAVVGNVAEVGCGNTASADTQPQLFNHALILDSGGNPTTLPVVSTDTLVVTYELRIYIDTTDTPYTVSINGTSYSGIQRRADVGTVQSYNIGGPSYFLQRLNFEMFTGAIQPITSQPIGQLVLIANGVSGSWTQIGTYTPGTYTTEWQANGPANAYTTGVAQSVEVVSSIGAWQFSLSPTISYNRAQNITMVFSFSWARYVP